MRKTLWVAQREFVATVMTKGFLFGIVITPVLILVSVMGFRLLFNEEAPRVEGEIAVLDPTGEVYERLRDHLRPEAIARRRDDFRALTQEQIPAEIRNLTPAGGQGSDAQMQAMEAMLGKVPDLDVVELAAGADLEHEKMALLEGKPGPGTRLALVTVHPDAVVPSRQGARLGNYDLYIRAKLDDRIVDELRDGLREAIVDARVERAGLDRSTVEALTRVGRPRSRTVTAEGEKDTNEVLVALLPAAFMLLLFASVMTSGQSLMTSTVEEKASRVVEVLLSAVSPMQLMTGKILGQLGVGFVILAVYAGMGVTALAMFAMLGMLELSLLFYLVIFYLIAHFVLASLLGAIGAAVNEIREAQNLMGPVMIVLMIPWLLWMPISRNPGSPLAVVASFLPPVNPFVMLIRMTSSTPPPTWQVWLSILVGLASVAGALWFAAKVFRVGLLMFGKPPDFKTLIRWVRMA